MKKVSIIIPFLNEQENIASLVIELKKFFQEISLFSVEIIFVNDGSTDLSIRFLQEQNFEFLDAKLISFSKNFGSHAALRAGILNSTGEYITFMYADLQDPINLVEKMFLELSSEENNEIVWATRESTENGFFETSFSKMYSSLMKKHVSPAYPSKGFDVVMFTKKVANLLDANIENNSSVFLQILTMGFKQGFISYKKLPRAKGKSKWTLGKKIKLFIDSFVAFSYAPIRFVTMVGITFFFLGILFTVYLVLRKLMYNDLSSGWPMLISILMLGFGITNISLGIIAEYLWRTLDSSRKRPVFIIDEIIELKKHE